MQYRMIMAASLALGNFAYAAPAPQITAAPVAIARRQEAGGSTVLDAPMTIKAGESFDGGNAVFDRGVSCTGQEEGGDSDAVFILEKGASLSNVHIGPNQIEGVHCNGGCTITNVFWDAVCEDAFSIKKQEDGETTTINGGGAKGAEDKVIQHNGGGTVVIKDFEVSDFGKMYRSCGNCDSMPARHVEVSGGSASGGKVLVGINPNMGDTAKISGIQITDVAKECVTYEGVTDGSEPKEVGTCDSDSAAGSDSGAGNETAPAESAAPATATGSDESAPAETSAEAEEPAATEAPAEGEEGDDQQEEQPEEESGDDEENKDEENQDEENQDEEQPEEEQPEEESGDEEESE